MRQIRRRPSFSSIAVKVGAVSVEQLRAAYAVSAQRGVPLDAVLQDGRLPAEVVGFVRDVRSRTRVTCGRCGGRVDRRASRREFRCRCEVGEPGSPEHILLIAA